MNYPDLNANDVCKNFSLENIHAELKMQLGYLLHKLFGFIKLIYTELGVVIKSGYGFHEQFSGNPFLNPSYGPDT